jgi:hypothetical protein
MDLTAFTLLLTPSGQEALQAAQMLVPREVDYLKHFQRLSRVYPSPLAQAALETAILRIEARSKFQTADSMYFTREVLEQASSSPVSAHRAERYRQFERLVDLGCSIGSDALNLGHHAPTVGIEIDPLRLAMAQANANELGFAERVDFLRADLSYPLPLNRSANVGMFFDPGRRTSGKRVHSVRDYKPPLSIVNAWLPDFPALGVKISPGVNKDEIRHLDAEIEFISFKGELKEAVLWFGPLKTAQYRATVLPGPHTLAVDHIQAALPLNEPQEYIYEPDPAVIRAGLVATLGIKLDASQLDPDIAYLTSNELIPTPFARVWRTENWLPFGVKRLRAYLRERNVGQVVIKKRGSPLQPEELIRMLRLSGPEHRVIFLTQLVGRPIVIVCYPQ